MRALLLRTFVVVAASVMLTGFTEDRATWLSKGPDPEMDAAIAAARKTLPKFWVWLDKRSPGFEDPSVKVGYPTRHGGVEFLWIGVDAHHGSLVSGEVLNEPEDVANVKAGQKVSFRAAEVVDWAYFKNDVGYGQYTTRVVVKRVSPAERWEQSKKLSANILEPGFD